MTDQPPSLRPDVIDEIERLTKALTDELVALRRDLHAHPELGGAELRTTRLLSERLAAAGLSPRVLPAGTGVLCDVAAGLGDDDGDDDDTSDLAASRLASSDLASSELASSDLASSDLGSSDLGRIITSTAASGLRTVALRADIDALPLADEKDVPYRSTVPGVCHACGHDVHAAAVLGAGLVLAELARAGHLPGRVRLVLQPAEEIMPGGAEQVIAAGGLEGVERIFALHCDPREEVGHVGLRVGGITASADQLSVRLTGRGGHTARPHLTADVVYALGEVVTRLPAALSRRVDPRAGLCLVWGRISAGSTANVIPSSGEVSGTVRCLDVATWAATKALIPDLVREIVAPYDVGCEVQYYRGVPPVTNEATSVQLLALAAQAVLGADGVRPTEQSLGGEDFAWYLDQVPGALVRLGVHAPGTSQVDLHRGDFDADERAIGIGVSLLVCTALLALQWR